jgi:NADP-dependent 3-hydroxy acid dehydrogenase YdfG
MSADTAHAVLITGCSTGIGRATAEHLAGQGFTVYATARRPESIADLEERGCRTLALDVTDEASMQAAVDAVEAAEGVGVLINNAGYSQSGAIESVDMEAIRRQFETNVFGAIRMAQLVLPGMRERGQGTIVNIGSMGGRLVFPGGGIYHATKHALEAVSDALRFEVKGFGVDVIHVQPGAIRTEFASTVVSQIDEGTDENGPYAAFNAAVGQATKDAYDRGPLKLLGGDAEDVAKAIGKAITARRPPIRLRITPSAKLLLTQRALMTDRVWDGFVATQFPRPKT